MFRFKSSLGLGMASFCLLALSGIIAASSYHQQSDSLASCWQDLAAVDSTHGYRAIWQLAKNPQEGVKLLRQNLTPASPPDEKLLKSWIDDLASPKFAIRDNAYKALEKQGELAEDALQKALQAAEHLETRRSIESLLERLHGAVASQDRLRLIRAVEALELIGTPDARELLRLLANGFPKHRMTIEAKYSLKRLQNRIAFDSGRVGKAFKPSPEEGNPLPNGVRMRIGTTAFRQTEFLSSRRPAFSSDSTILATPGTKSVHLWEIQPRKLRGNLDYEAACLVFSPRGSVLAMGIAGSKARPGAVVLRDLAQDKELGRIALPQDVSPQELVFHSGGDELIAKCSDNSLRFWEYPSLKELRAWKPADPKEKKTPPIKLMGFSPDGKHVVLQNSLTSVSLIDISNNSGQPLKGFQSSGDQVLFSPDGKSFATLNPSNAGLRIWDVASAKPKWVQKEVFAYTVPMAFSPDGKIVAAVGSGRKSIYLWDAHSGEFIRHLTGSEEFQVGAISPDSNWVAGVAGKTIRIWNINTGQAIPDGEGHVHAIEQLSFLPSLDSIATSSGDGHFLFWDMESGKQKTQLDTKGRNVPGVAFSSDGKLLVTSDMEGAVGIWNVAAAKKTMSLLGHGRLGTLQRPVQISPDGSYCLAWSSNDYYLRKWDMKTGRCLLEHRIRPTGFKLAEQDDKDAPKPAGLGLEGATFCTGSAFLPNADQLLLASRDGSLHYFDVLTGKETRVVKIGTEAYTPTVSHTGEHLAFRNRDTMHTQVISLASGKVTFTISLGQQQGQAAFSPDDRSVAVTSGNKLVLAEMATGKIRFTAESPTLFSKQLAFSPDGRLLITAMDDTSALIWDLAALSGGLSEQPKSLKK